jgi:hypothetical protein
MQRALPQKKRRSKLWNWLAAGLPGDVEIAAKERRNASDLADR